MAIDTFTLPLRRPITVHGKEGAQPVSELKLNMPSGRTVLRLGEPFMTKIERDAAGAERIEFKVIPAAAADYLAEMSGYNADLLGQMHPLDVLAAFDVLVKMLRPIEG